MGPLSRQGKSPDLEGTALLMGRTVRIMFYCDLSICTNLPVLPLGTSALG